MFKNSNQLGMIHALIFFIVMLTAMCCYVVLSPSYSEEDDIEKDIVIENEMSFYNKYIQNKYKDNFDKPYIINGFKHVEGEWNTGFVIEDEIGNQYVWVPISNNGKAQILLKKNFVSNSNILVEDCVDDNYEKFIVSALENGGFYISRYEIGKENETIVSKSNKEVLSNLSKSEISEKINSMYDRNDFFCELINGYAYDTTLEWIRNNDSIKTYYIKPGKTVLTGRNSNKNIYDLFDNVFEYTAETSYGTNIIRGVLEKDFLKEESRYALLEEDKSFIQYVIGARLIIYK